MRKKLLRAAGHVSRWLSYTGVGLVLLGAVVYVAARLWLPGLIGDKVRIEQTLSRLSGQTVKIERIQPHWDGIFPGVAANGIKVYAPGLDQPSIMLEQVRVSMSLVPLLQGRIGIHRLVAVRPSIAFERLTDGRYRVSGFLPLAAKTHAPDGKFVEWLFAQQEMSIEDGTLQWLDHRAPGASPLHLLGVNLSLANSGNRHQLKFNADFPAELCIHCAFEIDIEGNPLEGSDWGGRANIEAVGLDFSGLPYAAKSQLPKSLRGRFDLHLRTQWVKGRPRVAQGSIDAFGLVVPPFVSKEPLAVDRLRGRVRWQGKAGSWRLDVDDVLLALGGEPWSAGHLRLDHNPETTHAHVRHIAVEQLAAFSRHFDVPPKIRYYVNGLKPAGAINDLAIKWDRSPGAPSRFYLKSRLSRVSINHFEKIPGMKGISGYLVLDENSGDLRLNSRRAEMLMPEKFREKLALRSLLGQVHWERKEDRWEISAQDVRAAGDASARGNVLLRLPLDKSKSPYLRLRFDFNRAEGGTAWKYLPVDKLRPTLREFLDKSIVAGYGVKGHVVFDGETRRFPFPDGDGVFEVQTDIRDAVFRYLPGWTPITGGEVTLLFRGSSMLITAHSGWIDRMAVREVVVRKQDLKNRLEPVWISGRLTGPAESGLAVLRHSPMAEKSPAWRRFLAPGLEAYGPSALNLQIEIPHDHAEHPRINGEFRFHGSTVDVPIADFRFNEVNGRVDFTEAGITEGGVKARFLGEPTVIDIHGSTGPRAAKTVFVAKGDITADGLAGHFGSALGKFLKGRAAWQGELQLQGGRSDIRINSDLAGFTTGLPAPYHRLAMEKPVSVIETVESSDTSHRLRVRLGEHVTGVLDFRSRDGHWSFGGGQVALGAAAVSLPDHDGLHISLNAARLQGDNWAAMMDKADGPGLPDFVRQISAEVGDLGLFGYQLGRTRFDLRRKGNRWAGTTEGDTMDGDVVLTREDRGNRYDFNLVRLRIPGKTKTTPAHKMDPRHLPSIAVKAKQLLAGKSEFGALDFYAVHTDIGWRVLQLNIDRPGMTLLGSGSWYSIVGHDSVEMDLQLNSNDVEAMMEALGNRGMVRKGKLDLGMSLRWREDKARPGLANLDGNIKMSAKDGSLLNIKQGAARLAGLLNLDALSRVVTLDFAPVVGDGFAFKEITGRVAIKNGNAYTDAFTIDGSAADIVARGRIGLADEDIDLVAYIYPDLRGGVTLATGWLWGPATAAWILAAQQVLKKEIAKGTRLTYTISGKWKSPKIEKVVREPEPGQEKDE